MKRFSSFMVILTVILMVCLMAGFAFGQSWQRLKQPPSTISKFGVQVCKERVVAADSTTARRIVGSDTTIAIKMGTIPARSMITAAWVYVKEAFNQTHGTKRDSIAIGNYYDVDAYMSLLAVSSTGVKTGTLTSLRYCAADSNVYLYFLRRGSILTNAGDVVAGLEYVEFPR
jgi:hypothetical protein